MGTFGGHALPGSFFIIFALWWTVQIFIHYFKSLRRNIQYRSTVIYPCPCLCGKIRKWPMEAIVKLVFVSLGFSLEIITGAMNGKFFVLGNGQHATMFFFFGMSGAIDLLLYFKVSSIPKDLDYISLLLAVGIEGLLFHFHLHGRSELDVRLHTFLIFTIVLNVLAICFEIRYRTSLLAALGRAYCFLLQGTWFWQIGFILYNPNPNAEKWKGDGHDELMIATMIYAWHVGAVFLVVLITGGVVACLLKRFDGRFHKDETTEILLKSDSNGQTLAFVKDDPCSDSDV